MSNKMLCRISDDPSYDRSDYEEKKGYYAPRQRFHDALDEYPPMSDEEIQLELERIKKELRRQFSAS
jgi:hypothetical protein